jgi:hypothetical protein
MDSDSVFNSNFKSIKGITFPLRCIKPIIWSATLGTNVTSSGLMTIDVMNLLFTVYRVFLSLNISQGTTSCI